MQKLSRRFIAALLTVLMLAPLFIGIPTAKAAPVPDGTTSAITIYRWQKITDPYSFFRDKSHKGELLMTWLDGGQMYYFRYPLGDKIKNHWEGDYYNGKLILHDNLVSSQPILNDALTNGVTDFISETQMDCGLWYYVTSNNVVFGVGQNTYDYEVGYDSDNGAFVKPNPDYNGTSIWLAQNVGSQAQFQSGTIMKDDGKSISLLRHNGSRIFSSKGSKSNTDDNTRFNNVYTITPVEISAIAKNYSIANGQVLPVETTIYIPKGVTLTVKNGGTLSVGGQLLNDGKIVVEKGGLVVVKEGACIMPLTRTDTGCGAFISDGTVVVRKDAKLIGGGSTGLWFSSGGVTNFGMLASENFRASQLGIIETRTGGQIYAGKTINTLHYYEHVCSYLDKKKPRANSTITENSFQTILPSGRVLIVDNAIVGKGGTVKNFGSFGSQTSNPVIKVFVESTAYPGVWENILTAFDNEMGYYQSEPMHVTGWEYLDATGQLEPLRDEYALDHGSTEGFEQWLSDQYTAQGTNLNAFYDVCNGVFTVNGAPFYTVPWYQRVRVTKDGHLLREDDFPSVIKAIWGDGARPEGLPDEFADAPLLDKTFFIELTTAPGMRLEVAGGGMNNGDNVRIWSSQNANHMRWTFQKGEVLYRNGEKLYYYYIVNLNSGKVLHITSGTYAAEGQNIRQNAKSSSAFQQLFRVEKNRDGSYRIIPRGNDSYAMETNNGGTVNGSNVQVGTMNESTARWKLIQTEESPYVGKTFEIEPVCAPGMRLEIVNGSTYYGSDIGNAQIGSYASTATYQTFRFDKAEIVYENGEMHYYYYIVPAHWRHQLTTYTLPAKNGNNVFQGQPNGNTARQWRIVDNGDGTVGIVPRTNSSLRLHVSDGGSSPGTNVDVWTASEDDSMQWWIFPVGGVHADTPSPVITPDTPSTDPAPAHVYHGKTYELEPVLAPGMRLEIQDGSTGTGSALASAQIGTYIPGTEHQNFRFEFVESVEEGGEVHDYYLIIPVHSNLQVTTASLPAQDGNTVYQSTANGNMARQWRVIENEDGSVSLMPRSNSDLRLITYSGKTDPDVTVYVVNATDSALEKWWMIPAGSTPPDHSDYLPDLSNQVFEIESAAEPGRMLEVINRSSNSFGGKLNRVQLADAGGTANQHWRFVYAETVEEGGKRYDYYYILAEHTGHALMPDSTLTPVPGKYVIQYKLGQHSEFEKWRLVDNGDGTYSFVTKTADGADELRLTLEGGSTDAGTMAMIAVPDGSTAQKWRLNPVSRPSHGDEIEPPVEDLDNKVFEIESAAVPGMVVEVIDASTAINTNLQLAADADQTHQRWRFVFAETVNGRNYYDIIAVHSGLALTADSFACVRPNENVVQYTWKKYPSLQKWCVVNNGDGTYSLVAKMSQGCYDVRLSLKGGATAAGTQLVTAEQDGSIAQAWKLNPVE